MEINPDEAVAMGTALVVLLSHVAAILGKPEFIKGVKVLSVLWDVIAANYGKAKNKAE